MCITRKKKTAILQSLEPGADVSDATVEVDARSPFVLVLTIPAGLVSVLFLLVSSCSTSMFARAITHARACTRATDYCKRGAFSPASLPKFLAAFLYSSI